MSNKRKAPKRPATAGSWTAETRHVGKPFASGPDDRRNAGGRPKAVRELIAFAQDLGPSIQTRLKKIIEMGDDEAALAAIGFVTKWGMGSPPKKARGVVPTSATVEELEELLTEEAFEGDRAAVLALLAAKDPARYGKQGDNAPPENDNAVDVVDWAPAVRSAS